MISSPKTFIPWQQVNVDEVKFTLGVDRSNKPSICIMYGPACCEVAFVTPPCVTHWPRVTGDGNFGTMFGPTDILKSKFTLDLTDAPINGDANPYFTDFAQMMDKIEDKLLDFVHNNQLKILGRKNLTREEVKMLQIKCVKPKYDKLSSQLVGHSCTMTTPKFTSDGMGGKFERPITICDHAGNVVPNGIVSPGDVIAATAFANQVYTGVGGDKFGIHWSFEDVSVVCQRSNLDLKTQVAVFASQQYDFAKDYTTASHVETDTSMQFSDWLIGFNAYEFW